MRNGRSGLLILWLMASGSAALPSGVFPWPWQILATDLTPLTDIVYGAGRFVAVGASGYTSGTIITSTDGTNWIRTQTSPLAAVTYGGGRFIAVGSSGQVLSSEDGLAWTNQHLRSVTQFLSVAYGAGRYVAIGARVAFSSTNGHDWTEVPLPASVTKVAFGGGTFVAIGLSEERPVVLRSRDGLQWSSAVNPPTDRLQLLAFGQDRFLAISETQSLWASSDGSTWTEQPLERWLFGVRDLRYSGDRFIRHGRKKLSYSVDGAVWIDVPIELAFDAIAHGNGLFVAVGDGGDILISKDLVEWYGVGATPLPRDYASGPWLTYGAGRFVVAQRPWVRSPSTLSSIDGISWKVPALSSPERSLAIAYGNGRFVAVDFSAVSVSTDGEVWESLRVNRRLVWISFAGNQFLATNPEGETFSSMDGVEWHLRISGTTNVVCSAAFGPSGYVIVGENGTILHSRDGIQWSPVNSGTRRLLTQVLYGGGLYVAVGEDAQILTSADGIEWTARSSGTTTWLWDIDYGNGYFVAVGPFRILVSTDGSQWTVASVNTDHLSQVAFGNGRFLVMGNVIYQADVNQAVLRLIAIGQGGSDLSIFGLAGRTYRLQAADRLEDSAWRDLGTVPLKGSEETFRDWTAASAPRRFYRAILE